MELIGIVPKDKNVLLVIFISKMIHCYVHSHCAFSIFSSVVAGGMDYDALITNTRLKVNLYTAKIAHICMTNLNGGVKGI